ncbi:hypothetical protein B0T22DRAFT_246468 [Podospora appendiculata]|uniref:Tetraspanin n=1 Tax=Podospora appendiculata TaxID=314037 RepID=A0AAE0X295_9PEZI|nr:hypothetical protein B0T22DRAFT_246468 [Podospora appendiculata]
MASWIAIYPLIVMALIGVAIYEHVKATTLSLPLSSTLTILAIVLPLIAVANAIYFPYLLRRAKATSAFQRLLPIALQVLQLLLAAVLATLFSSDALPSATHECLLETKWRGFWTSHDGDRIRAIQDTFNCCGFRSVKDMAWPFPRGAPGGPTHGADCAAQFGRTASCKGPWEQAFQAGAGADLGVVLAVAVLQFASLVLMRSFGAYQETAWYRFLQRVFTQGGGRGGGGGETGEEEGVTRPLLGGLDGESRGEEAGRGVHGRGANDAEHGV